jgi:hypothetical protein
MTRVRTLEERFWLKVSRDGPLPSLRPELGPCWLWTASLDTKGYGQLNAGRRGAGMVRAHRVAYELAYGALPAGRELDHLCRRRSCVNPAHLEAVSRAENMRRGLIGEGRRRWVASITHCRRGHPYDPANTYHHPPHGTRICRQCQRDRERRKREAVPCAS